MMFDVEKSKTGRINTMIDAVTKAAAGDLSIRLETSDQADELDSLAEAINVMLGAVQEGRSGTRQADSPTQETTGGDNRLYENLLDAFASVDLNGQIQEANATFQALLGYTAEELRRLTYKELTPEKWHAFESHILQEQVMVQGYSQIYEKEYRRKDGTVFPVELRTFLIRAEGYQPVGMGTIVRDISERKRLEKELQRFRFSIDQAAEAVYWMDREGRFTYVNEAACRFLGYSREELLNLKVFDIDPALSIEEFGSTWAEDKDDGHVHRRYLETQHRRKDGDLIPVEVSATRLWLGDIEYHVAFVRDITERNQLEKELYLTQYCVEKASVGIHRTGPDGRFLSVNEKFCENLGYTREELCQMRVYEIDPEFSHEDWLAHRQGLRAKGAKTSERIHQRKDGTIFPVEITGSYVKYEDEGFSFAFTRDITERKQMEEQLMQARKMEAIGQLAGGVAHHFNNMLAVILGYAQLIKARLPYNDPSLKGILAIEKAAIHIRDITHQLLGFSRKQMIIPKPLNLNDLITKTKPTLARLIGNDIDLRFYPGQDLWQIKFDPAQVDQILVNLALNAREALPNEGNLTLETENILLDEAFCHNHHELKPGPYVRLTLSDNGVGMDQETLSHIFEPFFTTKEVGQGTGLGLATIYGIIKQNDGAITVHSELGHGTTFKIYFPPN
ncbi:MAG: PAS domain S-box protein [Anaerolineae bacterium]|nr:PAS domain S-box protein [Anaerolineae bacterium]